MTFSSGMAAVCTAITGILRPGDHVVSRFIRNEIMFLGSMVTIALTSSLWCLRNRPTLFRQFSQRSEKTYFLMSLVRTTASFKEQISLHQNS